MNIDTLNAYCGNELVSFPYLAQGRLNISQTVRSLHRAPVCPQTVPQSIPCGVCDDSTLGPHSLGWPVRYPNAYGAGLFSVRRAAQFTFRPEIR